MLHQSITNSLATNRSYKTENYDSKNRTSLDGIKVE